MSEKGIAPVSIELQDNAEEAVEKKTKITPGMIRGITVEIGGRTIPLRYTLPVQLQVEEELGIDFSEITGRLQAKKNTRMVISLIRMMGNAGLKHAGQDPDLTDEWLIDHIKPGYTTSYRVAAMGAVTAGWFMETDQGEQEQDDVLMEIRKKNGNTD